MNIIQISDTHLSKNNVLFFGQNSYQAFSKILFLMEEDLKNADAIFFTGDLSQDKSLESYTTIAEAFRDFTKNIYWIPGNHDSLMNMKFVFSQYKNLINTRKFSSNNWDFIFLNTTFIEEDFGYLSDQEFSFLEQELNESYFRSIAIVMHHHPINVDTPCIDKYSLLNKIKFWDLLSQFNVKLIMTGHVHGDYSITYQKTQVEASPATCFQIKKGALNLEIISEIGYKIFTFSENSYKSETRLWKNVNDF